MVIPTDLPALVAPVAWMLGTWEGWGMYAAPAVPGQEEPTEDSPVIEEIRGDVVGEQMRLVTRVYAGVASEPIDPTWDAAKGLSTIKKGNLISEETVYVSVAPSDAPLPPPGQYNSREFTATSASTEGHSAVWDGVSVGPRVQMAPTRSLSAWVPPASRTWAACSAWSRASSCGRRSARSTARTRPTSRSQAASCVPRRPPPSPARSSKASTTPRMASLSESALDSEFVDEAVASFGATPHFGDPSGEQWALEGGRALVRRPDLAVISVSGADRLTWLTSLSSQIVTDLVPGASRELLILSPEGRVEHWAGASDDGETLHLIVERSDVSEFVAFLESMRFALRVSVEQSDVACSPRSARARIRPSPWPTCPDTCGPGRTRGPASWKAVLPTSRASVIPVSARR